MLSIFLKKRLLATLFRLLPATIPATIADAALLFGIRLFVKLLNGDSSICILEWFLCMLAVTLLRFVLLRFKGSLAESSFRHTGALLQVRFFKTLYRMRPSYFHKQDSEIKLRSAFEATETLPKSGESFVQALQALVQLAVFLPILLYLSVELTVMLFCIVLPVVAFSQKKLRDMGHEEETTLLGEGHLRYQLEELRKIKRFWSANEEKRHVFKNALLQVKNLQNVGVRLLIRKITLSLAIETVSVMAMVIVLALCAYMISKGFMTAVDLVLYSSAVFLCYKPIKECTRAIPQMRAALTAYKALSAFESESFLISNTIKGINEYALCFLNANFSYGKICVFKNLKLKINFDKHVFLLGKNGCGKSTLLRLAGGLERLDSGDIEMHVDFIERGVFFLSQGVYLPPVEILRKQLEQFNEKNYAFLKFIEISGVLKLLHKERFSGGESAKVGLLWALVSSSKLLLLDEPLAFIARFDKEAVFENFLNACDAFGKRVIMSLHEEVSLDIARRFNVISLENL